MNNVKDVLKERFLLQHEYLGEDKPVNNIIPLVSVTVATYQHVNYVRACLDGILMQKTNFLYEIILGEDGSIDGTQDICMEYAAKYPDKIRLFLRDRALSQYIADDGRVIRFNGIWNRMSARGKYIAWCEGDDYWTDPLKLQKQVDFLEEHAEYGLCYTNVQQYYDISGQYGESWGGNSEKFEDLLYRNTIPTLSVLVRTFLMHEYYSEIKPESRNWKMGDYPMWLYVATKAKIKYMPFTSGCYRILENSASHSTNPIKRLEFVQSSSEIALYFIKKENIGGNLLRLLNLRISQINFQISVLRNDKKSMRKYGNKMLGNMGLFLPFKQNLKTVLLILFPKKMTFYFQAKH